MANYINYLVRKANISSGYVTANKFGDSILHSIEVGTSDNYCTCIESGKQKGIEVWLHLKRPLVTGECAEFDTIIESSSDIVEHEIKRRNRITYIYHLTYFPIEPLEGIFRKLTSTKIGDDIPCHRAVC